MENSSGELLQPAGKLTVPNTFLILTNWYRSFRFVPAEYP
jgi:hypothetical protein